MIEEFVWNATIVFFGLMPGLGLILYHVRDRKIILFTACGAAAAGATAFLLLVPYGRNLFAFYSVAYIFSALKLRSVGAGLLVASATVSYWEIPSQIYRFLGWWDAEQFSGWLWVIYGVAVVCALLFVSRTGIREAVGPLVASTAVNAVILVAYPTLNPFADNIWYLCRILTVLTLTYLVMKHGY